MDALRVFQRDCPEIVVWFKRSAETSSVDLLLMFSLIEERGRSVIVVEERSKVEETV